MTGLIVCLFGLCLVNYAGLLYVMWRHWKAIKSFDEVLWRHITDSHGGKP